MLSRGREKRLLEDAVGDHIRVISLSPLMRPDIPGTAGISMQASIPYVHSIRQPQLALKRRRSLFNGGRCVSLGMRTSSDG